MEQVSETWYNPDQKGVIKMPIQNHDPMQDLYRAFSAHTLEGLIDPMEFFNEAPRTRFYPCQHPRPDGTFDPMIFAEDCAGGKLPPNFTYELGHVRPKETFTGFNFDAICYDNPRYNLPMIEQILLLRAKNELAPAEGSSLQPYSGTVFSAASPICDELDNWGGSIRPMPSGLILQTGKGPIRLTNFRIEVLQRRLVFENGREPHLELLLRVTRGFSASSEIVLNSTEIDNAVRIIQARLPACHIAPDAKNGAAHVAAFIRDRLDHCPEVIVIRSAGLIQLPKGWVFSSDNAHKAAANVLWETGKHLMLNPQLSAPRAFFRVLEVLKLSPRLELMLPILLLMHLGPVFPLFQAAGYQPRFVTFLAGTTGSLKTSLALALFRIYAEDPLTPPATFSDTVTALEQKLGRANGSVLVIDDYCPGVTTAASKEKVTKLESVIRFVGDGVSKSRCKANLSRAAEYPPSGCAFVTGELTGGSHSSYLRCLILTIEKGDIDGRLLEAFQLHPEVISTHLSFFLSYCAAHGNELITFIAAECLNERQYFAQVLHERRLADTGAALIVTAKILSRYAVNIGAMTIPDADAMLEMWRSALAQALRVSESFSREEDPLAVYLGEFFNLIDAGKIILATNAAAYTPSTYIGFKQGRLSWLLHAPLHELICQHLRAKGLQFHLQESAIRKLLHANNLIEVSQENSSDKGRIVFTKRASVEGRPRMLVLRTDAARSYVEHHLNF